MKDKLDSFNRNLTLKKWEESLSLGNLKDELYHHWKKYIPIIYNPDFNFNNPTQLIDDDKSANDILFKPMEYFICGGDPDEVFNQLKNEDVMPNVCGKLFKNGQPTYSCIDCAADGTCVLCSECFQHSEHKKHRYKIFTSSGGGICDCGDIEAWKMDPYCTMHMPKNNIEQENSQFEATLKSELEDVANNALNKLSQNLVNRAGSVLMSTIQYSVLMLTWQDPLNLPPALDSIAPNENHVTMLYNDEIHTYEQVINTLCRAIDCSHKEGVEFATTVDREGRSPVMVANVLECDRVKSTIERATSRHGGKSLKVLVFKSIVVAHQNFAYKLLIWINYIIAYSDGLRLLLCNLTTQPYYEDEHCILEHIILYDTHIWKIARMKCHELFMSNMLLYPETKKKLALLFTQHYSTIAHDYIESEHWYDDSVSDISVQIFTTPSISRFLIVNKNVLAVVIETFIRVCQQYKNADGKLSFDRNQQNNTFRRAQYILNDLHYLMISPPKESEWTEQLKKNFLNGFNSMINLLCSLQNMDTVTRQIGQHLDYEPEWETAFNVMYKLIPCLISLEEWIVTDKQILIKAYIRTCKAIWRLNKKFKIENVTLKTSSITAIETNGNNEIKADAIKYDVSVQPVSVHLPVTRMFVGIYIHLFQYGMNFFSPQVNYWINSDEVSSIANTKQTISDQIDQSIVSAALPSSTDKCNLVEDTIINKDYSKFPTPIELMEYPMRTLVLCAQVQAGMWRRNGYSLLNQVYLYHNAKWRSLMYDRDIAMLQIGTSLSLGGSCKTLQSKQGVQEGMQEYRDLTTMISNNLTERDTKCDTLLVYWSSKYNLISFLQAVLDKSATLNIKTKQDPDSNAGEEECSDNTKSKGSDNNAAKEPNKDNLNSYSAFEGDEETVRQNAVMLEEFLSLVIVIISERYFVGIGKVTDEDIMEREILHQLCLGPISHSELVKALPENAGKNTSFEKILAKIATLKKTTDITAKTKYVLKRSFYKRYNPFFYHYTKSEQSKAEEYKKIRKCETLQEKACPPPVPPEFLPQFEIISEFLCSDLLIRIELCVLICAHHEDLADTIGSNKLSHFITDILVHEVLHLICLALYEEKRRITEFDDIHFGFLKKAKLYGFSDHLRFLAKDDHKFVSNHFLVAYTLSLYDEVTKIYDSKVTNEDSLKEDNTHNLIENSKHSGPSNQTTPITLAGSSSSETQRKKRGELAKIRRLKILSQMNRAQKNFIKGNKDLWDSIPSNLITEESKGDTPSKTTEDVIPLSNYGENIDVMFASEPEPIITIPEDIVMKEQNEAPNKVISFKIFSKERQKMLAIHKKNSSIQPLLEEKSENKCYTCILCQEDQILSLTSEALVMAAFVQNSTVLRRFKSSNVLASNSFLDDTVSMSKGPVARACGHVMHARCWHRFYDAVSSRERRHALRFRFHHATYDVERGEYLCPLCNTLGNGVMPILPPTIAPKNITMTYQSDDLPEISMEYWLKVMNAIVRMSVLTSDRTEDESWVVQTDWRYLLRTRDIDQILKLFTDSELPCKTRFKSLLEPGKPINKESSEESDDDLNDFSVSILTMIKTFSLTIYTVSLDLDPYEDNDRIPLMAWYCCSFTIAGFDSLLLSYGNISLSSLCNPSDSSTGAQLKQNDSKVLAEQRIPDRYGECLRLLVRYTKTFTSKCVKRQLVKHHALTFCKTIFTLPHVSPSCDKDTLEDNTNLPPCNDQDPVDKAHQNYSFLLDSDMFSFLVKICLSCHSIFAEKDDCSEDITCQADLSDHFFLKLLYIAQVVQILLVYRLKSIGTSEGITSDSNVTVTDQFKPNNDGIIINKDNVFTAESDYSDVPSTSKTVFWEKESHSVVEEEMEIEVDTVKDESINVNDDDHMSDENSTKEAHFIHQLWVQIKKIASGQEYECADNEELKEIRLLRHLKISLIPFLRCSAIFFHFLTDIPFPGGVLQNEPVSNTSPSYFEALCDYLDIPTSFQILFQSGSYRITDLIKSVWLKHPKITALFSSESRKNAELSDKIDLLAKRRDGEKSSNFVINYPLKTPSLIRLPHDYADLIFSAANFVCPNASASADKSPKMASPNSSRAPTLCLVCGTVLCSQSYCCQTDIGVLERGEQTNYDNLGGIILGDNLNPDDNEIPEEERGERTRDVPRRGNTRGVVVIRERESRVERDGGGAVGACAAHAYRCGAGTGIFLRIRECQILFLSGRTKGTFYPSPYIDAYGETDQGLRRGNPLFLCPERYENLQKIWLSNSIPDKIARSLEANPNLLSIDWQHL
ncbi:unnamed protein product [Gordionus sp. m RMFG-2023]|uniref:E3 ubiquitin-protein ligase UBR2-like isoform X1 n=1 Tax=Gordionus sp. m RMFG-2023 TaxID=3053472 RepID=UPI0030E1310F